MKSSHGRRFGLVTALALMACDPSAKASGSDGLVAGASASARYESCGSTLQCKPGLRCVDGICTDETASVLGDYHAAAGKRLLERGDIDGAVAAYSKAVSQYQADGIEVPPALYCAQGKALSAGRKVAENAELGARVLHRCVSGTPAGSLLRAEAMAELALLGDVGLDPLHLARTDEADRYITGAPRRPPSDSIGVKAEGDSRTSAASYRNFLDLLGSDQVREELLPCWEAHWKATQNKQVAVTLPFRYRFHEGLYQDQDRYRLTIEGDAPAGGSPEVAAQRCVREALAPLADEYSRRGGAGRWDANITVTLGD
jgi:hypothetical protein